MDYNKLYYEASFDTIKRYRVLQRYYRIKGNRAMMALYEIYERQAREEQIMYYNAIMSGRP